MVQKQVKVKSELVKSSTGSGWHFLIFDGKVATRLGFEDKFRRVLCSMNGAKKFHCALMPWGDKFYIIVNKKRRDELGLTAGVKVDIVLEKDESKYGLPMSAELKEVLKQDRDGDRLFHALSPGKQRSMLYWLSRTKDIDRRIHEALIFIEHMKKNDGKIDGRKLMEEMKRTIAEW
ncbi:MAG TPA: DUF1905 domain-containing protein [Pyrinomonadaceae bacterium]|nr:DUF1905 domain-containing protein [Pyrinomonadaceae bacterium]